MIKNIKIYGERNSGTRYLRSLLKKNLKNINLFQPFYKHRTGWKHGFPVIKNFNNLNNTLFIFIIRDLDSWLKSMFNNPYHYKKSNNIKKFLTNPLQINEKRFDHNVHIDQRERNTIIELRYHKIKSYILAFKDVKNAIFINLSDLQKNYTKFILFLNKKYKINIVESISNINRHTKSAELNLSKNNIKKKNRNYDTILPEDIIEKRRNDKIEEFVNNLKEKYHYKTNIT